MTDDKPPCEQCAHSYWWKPDFIVHAPPGLLCRHPSALRINGAHWHVSLAREVCKGRRWEKKRDA